MFFKHGLLERLKEQFADCDDLIIRSFPEKKIEVLYFGHLVGEQELHDNVILPFTHAKDDEVSELLKREEYKLKTDYQEMVIGIIEGKALIIHKNRHAYIIDIYVPKTRAIEAAEIETVIVGPKEAFIEEMMTNLSMIRRRIRSPHLKVLCLKVGKITNTDIALLYIEGITPKKLVQYIEDKMLQLDIKGVTDLNMLTEHLDREQLSIFPQFFTTERPDVVVSKLLDGRVVGLVDGSPYAFSIPTNFFEFFQSPDDYNQRWLLGTLSRILRYTALFITLFASAFYVAVCMFHYEMMPSKLLNSFIESRNQVPFNPFIEAILIESIIELLREAGARLPTKIGMTIGVVGGIVIGTAAVEAGFTSNILVIVVSISAISSFVVPHIIMTASLRITRFLLIILSAIWGIFGIILGFVFILIHLNRLKVVDEFYLTPIAPFNWSEWKNTIIRAPFKYLEK